MPEESELATEMKEFEGSIDFFNSKISELRKTYPDKFVAFKGKNVVVTASSMDELIDKASEKHLDLGKLLVEFVSSKETLFIL